MKPGARRKRAVAAGANEDELEEVDDAEDPQAAMIALIVKYEAPPPASVATIPAVKPHFSAADSGDSKTTRFESLFGDKHCMFSYNWAVQEEVKAARAEVGAAGVPTWMDIDGEPPCPRKHAPSRMLNMSSLSLNRRDEGGHL